MIGRRLLLTVALSACIAAPALAHDYKFGQLRIDHPWARAAVAGNGGAFLTIENTGAAADRLLGAASPVSGLVELHTHIKDGDIMRMRAVDGIDLPPGSKVVLQPGGYHIMLLGLKKPLKEGETFKLMLEFEKAGKVEVDVTVDKPGASAAGHGEHKR